MSNTDQEGSKWGRGRERSRSPRRKDDPNGKTENNQDKPDNIVLAPKNRLKRISIQMKLGGVKKTSPTIKGIKPQSSVAVAFNPDEEDEPEELPREAKMRMRNIGRDTPTSSGPNSFGKTKYGFSDAKKIFEKNLKEAMESARADD